MGDFGTKYAKVRRTKDHNQDYATRKKSGIHEEKNYIVQHAVDEIILKEKTLLLSVKYETHENIDDEFNEDELYKFDRNSLD